ncbi:acyltransferase family protein [Streptacidiphilus sp. EB129]|uniref:acyltransferase family protein n=1 Tax=Streptacidiphilus sp. EB129 TaxID=3156262 RepID=UPI00351749F3
MLDDLTRSSPGVRIAAGRPSSRPGGGRIAVLDGLRLLAALMVVGYHYLAFGRGWDRPVQQLFPHLYRLASYGWLGVYLFFLISGFVICLSCWGRGLGSFFVSRTIRLYPAYWFAVLLTTVVLTFIPGPYHRLSLSDVGTNLTMMQEPVGISDVDGVYWTLWTELRFYLVFALVVWKGLTYRRVVIFCCLWACASIVAGGISSPLLDLVVMPDVSWYFIAGMAFFLMWKFRSTALLWGIVAFSFLMGQHYLLLEHVRAEGYMRHTIPTWGTAVFLVAFFALMAGVALGWFDRIAWRWLPSAGALTYPLYLLHEYIGWNVISRLQHRIPPLALVALLVVGMAALAWCVNRFVERPGSTLLRRVLTSAVAEAKSLLPPGRNPGSPGRQSV